MLPFAPAADASIVVLESMLAPGGFFADAYDDKSQYKRVRLVNSSPHEKGHQWQNDPWALFKIQRLSEDSLVTIEALRFPGFFFDVYGDKKSQYKSLRLVNSVPTSKKDHSWGIFRMRTHDSVESELK